MAFIKMNTPVIMPIESEPENSNPTYGTGMVIGKAISANISPTYTTDSLYGDDDIAEEISEFVSASVELNTTHLDIEAEPVIFGHTITEDKNGVISNISDEGKYVGVGFIKGEVVNGVRAFYVVLMHKVRFTEDAESANTKGSSITWNTPTIKGTGIADKKGDWRTKEKFATFQAAYEYLMDKANITMDGN